MRNGIQNYNHPQISYRLNNPVKNKLPKTFSASIIITKETKSSFAWKTDKYNKWDKQNDGPFQITWVFTNNTVESRVPDNYSQVNSFYL